MGWPICLVFAALAAAAFYLFRTKHKAAGSILSACAVAALAFLIWYFLPFGLPKADAYYASCRLGNQTAVLNGESSGKLAKAVNEFGLRRGMESLREPMPAGSFLEITLYGVGEAGDSLLGDLVLRLDQTGRSLMLVPGAFGECRPGDAAGLLEKIRPILEEAGIRLP